MSKKAILCTILTVVLALGVYLRQKHSYPQVSQYLPPLKTMHPYDNETHTGYTLGLLDQHATVQWSFWDRVNLKRINSYVFSHYNKHKIEVSFIDLGYTSVVYFGMFDEDVRVSLEERVGFGLDNHKFLMPDIDISKNNFQLKVRTAQNQHTGQIMTTLNLSISRSQIQLQLNLTHIFNESTCFTITRQPKILTHRCYGGAAEGKLSAEVSPKWTVDNRTKLLVLNFNRQLSRTLFDGFRGSGMHWNWTWASGLGFNKQSYLENKPNRESLKSLGLNFGTLKGQPEDFIVIDGEQLAVKGLKYNIPRTLPIQAEVLFTAEEPPMSFSFIIEHSKGKKRDLGLLKIDMLKA